MAENNNFSSNVESLFKGMDAFLTTKTVVGDAIQVQDGTIILPLVDVSFGVGAGAFGDDSTKKNNAAGANNRVRGSIFEAVRNLLKVGNTKESSKKITTKKVDYIANLGKPALEFRGSSKVGNLYLGLLCSIPEEGELKLVIEEGIS